MAAKKKASRKTTARSNGTATKQDKGMKQRLGDQLSAYKKAVELKAKVKKLHVVARDLPELAFYPAHDKRKETPAYKQIHHEMVVQWDLPCLVCGVKNSTLHDPKENPYGAKQLETHHHIIEWALAKAIDGDKFNKILRPFLAHRHQNNPTYAKEMSQTDIEAWVDHSPDNLWVLCDVHHRAKFFGIHEMTYPIWCPQDLLRPDFEDFVRQELESLSPPKKAKTTAKKKAAKKKA